MCCSDFLESLMLSFDEAVENVDPRVDVYFEPYFPIINGKEHTLYNHADRDGFTLLMTYLCYSKPALVETTLKILQGSKLSVDHRADCGGRTALLIGSYNESIGPEVVERILDAGADPHTVDINGHGVFASLYRRKPKRTQFSVTLKLLLDRF